MARMKRRDHVNVDVKRKFLGHWKGVSTWIERKLLTIKAELLRVNDVYQTNQMLMVIPDETKHLTSIQFV